MFLSEQVETLSKWFVDQRSEYPWREQPTPYRVWISEVMLQQTQVQRVVLYFSRWMEALPSIQAVAEADEDELIKLWEGLGYYSRVRNIHKAAKHIVSYHGGNMPSTEELLFKIPGLGPYTVAAIQCFGFRKRALPIDANVIRVLSRIHRFTERGDTAFGKKKMQELASYWIPEKDPHIVAEGLIEFGQKVCGKNPRCHTCPLRRHCLGKDIAETLPVKKPPKEKVYLCREVILLLCKEKVWVFKEERKGVMQGLWQFPYDFDIVSHSLLCKADLQKKGAAERVRHGFTHHTVDLFPTLFFIDEEIPLPYGAWYGVDALHTLPFSSGHRTIARELFDAVSHRRDALRLLRS